MLTKKEVERAFDTWEDILIEVSEKCIICNKWEYWEVMILKIPEGVLQCLKCAEKYPDNKIYKWVEWWWNIYKIWYWIIGD